MNQRERESVGFGIITGVCLGIALLNVTQGDLWTGMVAVIAAGCSFGLWISQ